MPAPKGPRPGTREKCRRECVVCGIEFYVKSPSYLGRVCSQPCKSKHISNLRSGQKQSPEVVAKRAAGIRAMYADPERRARGEARRREALKKWLENPANAALRAKQSSERMKRRHADPEWQKKRDARSSATMKRTWEARREHMLAAQAQSYQQMVENGTGICSDEAKQNKATANKWIMKRAWEAMMAETDYSKTYGEVQMRLRREMPYDGPQEGSDYIDYLQKLCRAIVSSPECRAIQDSFMSEAIPRFAEEWKKRKALNLEPVGPV